MLGQYQILDELSHSPAVSVYRARNLASGRDEALTVLPEIFIREPGFAERFSRVMTILAALSHPNLPAIRGYGLDPDLAYVAIDIIGGVSMAEKMGRRVGITETIAILGPMASALDLVHRSGLVHRDLNPASILLTPEGVPALMGVGLAQLTQSDRRLSQTGTLLGRPEYMAPEVCAGQEASPMSDQYSLGVIAFEMLTGQPPFAAPTPMAVLMAQVNQPPPSSAALNPYLAGAPDLAILRVLAKAPGARFASCAEFIAALQPTAATPKLEDPLPALPAAPVARSRRSRRALLIAVLIVVAVVIIVALGIRR
jgi:serine/threonine protein kinase